MGHKEGTEAGHNNQMNEMGPEMWMEQQKEKRKLVREQRKDGKKE